MVKKENIIKHTKYKWILIILVSIGFVITANYLVPISFKVLVILALTIVLSHLIYKVSLAGKLFRAIISLTVYGLVDTVVSFVFIFIFKFDMVNAMQDPHSYILYNLISILLLLIIALILSTKNNGTLFGGKKISRFTERLLFSITALQIIRICVEFIIWHNITSFPNLQYLTIVSYSCSILSVGLLLYTTSVIIDRENVIKMTNEYNEKLNIYNDLLQNSIENQRKIAHEHGNQLTVLSGYIANGELDNANQYLLKIVGKENIDNEYLQHIKESGLKALLVFKMAMMEKKSIEFETVIDEDLEDTIIPSDDMCNIMGVFLDNAIDAATQTEEPYISLSIIRNDGNLIISVMNSIKDNTIDTAKIFKKGYSSKGEGRGFGLFLVDEIIKKYEELELQTRVEDGLFIQELYVTDNSTSLIKM